MLKDFLDDVTQAARAILVATAGRLDTSERRAFAQTIYSQSTSFHRIFSEFSVQENPDSKMQSIFTLAIFGSQWNDSLSKE